MPLNAIREILDLSIFIDVNTHHAEVTFKELDRGADLENVTIHGLGANSIAIKHETTRKRRNQFFRAHNSDGINKGCDGIIVELIEAQQLRITLCELKSFVFKPKEYERQLINSKMFIAYVLDIVANFYNIPTGEVDYRFALFYRPRVNKKTPRGRTPVEHIQMEHFPAINISRIQVPYSKGFKIHLNEIV